MNQNLPPPPVNPVTTSPVPTSEPLSPDEFNEIDTLLDELRSRYDETPQWEFCEGFMAALRTGAVGSAEMALPLRSFPPESRARGSRS